MWFKERLVIYRALFTRIRLASALSIAFVATLCALVGPQTVTAAGTHLDKSFMFGVGKKNFSFGTSSYDNAYAVAIQPDGKIVIVGRTMLNGNWDFAIARFWPDGAPDSSFDGDGLATLDFAGSIDTAVAVAIQPDGKIVLVGESISNGNSNFAVARVTEFGIPDATFDGDGRATFDFQGQNDMAQGVAIQPDGKIVVAGYAGVVSRDFGVLRLTTGGLPDSTFGNNGRVTTDFTAQNDEASGVAVLPDGKIVVAGTAGVAVGTDFALARYTSLGVPDNSFQSGGKLSIDVGSESWDFVKAFEKTPDGKLVIGGETASYGGYPKLALVRCSTDGVLDSDFDGDGRVVTTFNKDGNNFVNGVAVNGSGEIAVAARIDGSSMTSGFNVIRFLSNGKLDSRFGAGGRVNTLFGLGEKEAKDVAFQADGKIVAIGTVRGFDDFGVARYTSRGIAAGNDFDGDGAAELGVYRPTEGMWYLQNGVTGAKSYVRLGIAEDIPVTGDYDGDGKADMAVFRPSTGTWYVRQASDGQVKQATFGVSSDWPVPGDYDGDGITDLAVYRLANGYWYLLQSSRGFEAIKYGSDVAFPLPGDYDGDGATDLAVYRPADKTWWIHGSHLGDRTVQFGSNGDTPVPADYDGDGVTDIAIFRGDGNWWVQRSQTNTITADRWGLGTDLTATGDFDGDGKVDLSVFRPSNGAWYMTRGDGTWRWVVWGISSDYLLTGVVLRTAS